MNEPKAIAAFIEGRELPVVIPWAWADPEDALGHVVEVEGVSFVLDELTLKSSFACPPVVEATGRLRRRLPSSPEVAP